MLAGIREMRKQQGHFGAGRSERPRPKWRSFPEVFAPCPSPFGGGGAARLRVQKSLRTWRESFPL
jgi:hypothetical protein